MIKTNDELKDKVVSEKQIHIEKMYQEMTSLRGKNDQLRSN